MVVVDGLAAATDGARARTMRRALAERIAIVPDTLCRGRIALLKRDLL
jgi:hypothetical protein